MRTAIKDVRRERAYGKLRTKERRLTKVQKSRHHAIAFRRDIQTHPEDSQLRVKPVQCEQEKAFVERAQVMSS